MEIKLRAVKFMDERKAVGVMLESLKSKDKLQSILGDDLESLKFFEESYSIPNKWHVVCDGDTSLYHLGTDVYVSLKENGLIADEKEIEVGKEYALEHDRKIKCWGLKDGEVGDTAYTRYNGHVVKKGEKVKILDDEYLEYVLIKVGDTEVKMYIPEFEYDHYKEFGGHYGNHFDLIYG